MEQIPSKLADLAGEGVFEIAPYMAARHPLDPDANGVIFTISGRTYLVFEDPSDGYRSSAGPLLSFAGASYELGYGDSSPDYIREPVVCTHRARGEYSTEDDILEVRSKETGALIFEIGTRNVDDYYPYFHTAWHPEGLSANARERL